MMGACKHLVNEPTDYQQRHGAADYFRGLARRIESLPSCCDVTVDWVEVTVVAHFENWGDDTEEIDQQIDSLLDGELDLHQEEDWLDGLEEQPPSRPLAEGLGLTVLLLIVVGGLLAALGAWLGP